ncbi:type III secretion system inner membrane ring lipoprotein SctJ [Actimicrobium sp. CCI2.3]|uniref:type III secretion system inner membrane ring lipoprotein SctJ n=1 Tax=Actimicrobium sp. CCI2.3 TaxID=3048616 RepID=UPI002AB364C1|nr:type III secretion inner membrane ring lipoprotein SctJ [Actimicrobium sp. CCI2.3]MDY7574027.1 type III secretion inner membrane ring lipoprotein SctJ [Actimicrobium sp. CCI2.3]MEB0021865.1 type III secretion inner membrane ring lipoprotein SctJ [Actimicrobium sp. CCI2.3]
MSSSMLRIRTILPRWVLQIALLLLMWGCSQVSNLQTNLQEADANEIVALLRHNGIEAKKIPTKEGVTLTVRETDVPRATDIMRAAGLPKRSLSNLGTVFKKEGMISTPLEERVRYIHALSEELEFTLQQFDHVVSARVHVVLPERIAPGEPIQPSSAAVFVKYTAPFDEDTNIPRITNLVASSIPGLSGVEGRSKVSVVLAPAGAAPAGVEWESVGPFVVQSESASGLMWTLTLLTITSLAGVVAILWLTLTSTKIGKVISARGSAKIPGKSTAT